MISSVLLLTPLCLHTDKMADEVSEGIENALNIIVSMMERSGNMKK